jgi:hypothetical protein
MRKVELHCNPLGNPNSRLSSVVCPSIRVKARYPISAILWQMWDSYSAGRDWFWFLSFNYQITKLPNA